MEGRPPGSEPRLPFASQWVFSSLKCCGKRLPLLPRYLLLLRWKQKPFVREDVKQFGLKGLSGCSEPAGPPVPGSRRGRGQEKSSPGLCWCSGTRPHPYQLPGGMGVPGKGTPPGCLPLAARSPPLRPFGCRMAQLFRGLPKRRIVPVCHQNVTKMFGSLLLPIIVCLADRAASGLLLHWQKIAFFFFYAFCFKHHLLDKQHLLVKGHVGRGKGLRPHGPRLAEGSANLGGVGATPGTTDMGGEGEMQWVMAVGRDVLSGAALRNRLGLGAARPPWPPRCPPSPRLPSRRLRATAYLGWTCFGGTAEIDAAH